MCRAGGPRCKGSGRSTSSAAATTTSAVSTATKTEPSRTDVDRMAAELSPDRKGWDGSPLNDRDKRFFALRDSGWTGPIDQDGYPATSGTGADTLRHMAEKRGETVDW